MYAWSTSASLPSSRTDRVRRSRNVRSATPRPVSGMSVPEVMGRYAERGCSGDTDPGTGTPRLAKRCQEVRTTLRPALDDQWRAALDCCLTGQRTRIRRLPTAYSLELAVDVQTDNDFATMRWSWQALSWSPITMNES